MQCDQINNRKDTFNDKIIESKIPTQTEAKTKTHFCYCPFLLILLGIKEEYN